MKTVEIDLVTWLYLEQYLVNNLRVATYGPGQGEITLFNTIFKRVQKHD